MKRLLKDAFKGDVDLDDVRVIYDIVGWMNEKINKIENHSRPNNFKFEKIAGEVNLFYRLWSSSEEWTNAGKLIQNNLTLDKGIKFKIPEYEKVDIPSIQSKLDSQHSRRAMTEDQAKEWGEFMQGLKKYKRRWGIMPNPPKTNWALTLLRKQPEKQHVHKDSENLRRMGEMMEKEEIITKKVFIEVFIFKNGFNEINHRLADHFSLHLTKDVTREQIAILKLYIIDYFFL